jgi:tetratricopeptide (TPR) repeat protein
LELNPDIAQAWNNLANAYLQKGDVEKAIETGQRLLKLAPDFGLGHNNLAFAYYTKGDYEKALEHVDRAVALGFEVHPEFLERLKPHREASGEGGERPNSTGVHP